MRSGGSRPGASRPCPSLRSSLSTSERSLCAVEDQAAEVGQPPAVGVDPRPLGARRTKVDRHLRATFDRDSWYLGGGDEQALFVEGVGLVPPGQSDDHVVGSSAKVV